MTEQENKQGQQSTKPAQTSDSNAISDAKKEKQSGSRILGIVGDVFTGIMLLIAVAMMLFTVISVNTFDRNDRDLFGYKAFIVRSDSMSATDFNAGDLVLVKEVDPTTLVEGDIIAFRSEDAKSYGETFTHKIRSITVDAEGNPAFITYGTTTNVDDETPVPFENVMGKYQTSLPKVGSFFTFLKTVPGYICCIFLPFMLLIVIQGINCVRLFRLYKEEEMAEVEAKRQQDMAEMAKEREKLAAERAESQKMLEELQRLQAQVKGDSKKSE